jgi:streptomycin 6-kinase
MLGRHHLAGRPFDRGLAHEAVSAIRDLVPTQGAKVLLHGDLHLGNVLDAGEGRWLAVDPKPLIGEREFDVTALIRDKADELAADPKAGRERVQHRFDLLSERLGLERGRLKSWSLAILVDYAIWDFETGASAFGRAQAAVAEMIRQIEV